MASLPSLQVREVLKNKRLKFINSREFGRLFGIKKANTLYKILQRLEKQKILQRIDLGLYLVSDQKTSDFAIANALRIPSYVSLETALSYYGILSQFPYTITSTTTRRNREIKNGKVWEYVHLAPRFYWGFTKNQDFLIAFPEKALLDMFYLISKGLRRVSLEELDYSCIDRKRMRKFARQFGVPVLKKLLKEAGLE